MPNARYWIDRLQLQRHPEGGFFRETYRAGLTFSQATLPDNFKGSRHASTAIYFLLEGDDFSAFHRIASDEMWHFYAGDALSVHVIDKQDRHVELKIGANADKGEIFQAVAPAHCWFASCLTKPGGFALVGCTVSPGFDFADFEIGERTDLGSRYPQHRLLIERFTR